MIGNTHITNHFCANANSNVIPNHRACRMYAVIADAVVAIQSAILSHTRIAVNHIPLRMVDDKTFIKYILATLYSKLTPQNIHPT